MADDSVIDEPATTAVVKDEKKDEPNDDNNEAGCDSSSSPDIPPADLRTQADQTAPSKAQLEDEKGKVAQAMTLDVAYRTVEMVRKVNLQVEFGKEVDSSHCIPCLRAEHSMNLVKSKLGKWMAKKVTSPCLTCGSPVCKLHRSSDFGKQNITICCKCSHLFSVDYLVHNIMQEEDSVEKKKRVNAMLGHCSC